LDEIPTALLEYAFGMAERAEPFDSMVCAYTARTDPAERQIVLRDVHDRAVDGDVARRRAVKHLASVRVVVAEVVEREWSGPCVHVVDGVIDVAVAEDWQDGAEDLLVRNLHLVGDAEHDGRREGVRTTGGVAGPVSDLDDPCAAGASVVDQVDQHRILLVVDDRGVVLADRAVGEIGRASWRES